MTELEQFEKYASDTYNSIERYETLPTKPYKSLEVEAAHDAWMFRAMIDTWQLVDDDLPPFNMPVYAGSFIDGIFHYSEYVITDSGEGWLWSRVVDDTEWLEDDDYSHLTHWHYKLKPPMEQQK